MDDIWVITAVEHGRTVAVALDYGPWYYTAAGQRNARETGRALHAAHPHATIQAFVQEALRPIDASNTVQELVEVPAVVQGIAVPQEG